MSTNKRYLVIAHYHKKGLIRDDLTILIKTFYKKFNKIVFVSTKLNIKEIKKINKYAKIITRPNYGYDFYSYKVGTEYLRKINVKSSNENNLLYLLPSSLIFDKPSKLLKKFLKIKNLKNCVYGLSKSWEICEHLQSEMYIFSFDLFNNKNFFNWWKSLKKFKSRQIIIFKYEIGFSNFLKKEHIRRLTLFTKNIENYPTGILKNLKQRIFNIFFRENKIYKKNPMHFYWKDIYKEFGILKIELFKSNPHKINMDEVINTLSKKKFEKIKLASINN